MQEAVQPERGTNNLVGSIYYYWGGYHGFDNTIATGSGPNNVCAYGINVQDGTNTTLGCITV